MAMVTMCSRMDFARCALLVESVDRFVPQSIRHYVIVDKRDYDHFSHMNTSRRTVLKVEDILPWWIMRVPRARRWWLSFKSVPIRNWFLQQIVKLGVSTCVDDDVLIFVDADVTFFRPFEPGTWVRDDKVRLFRVPNANPESHFEWHRTAGSLLGLGARDYFGASYIGNLITWRRDHVLQLHEHIQKVSGRAWQESICRGHWHLSEYILYGVFVDKILGDDSGHFYDELKYCHAYWGTKPLSEQELQAFMGEVRADDVALMISSKAGISPDRYAALLKELV